MSVGITVSQTSAGSIDGGDAVPNIPRDVQEEILRAVAAVRYGSVEVVIQDGNVVQIESREKKRIKSGARISG